MLHEQKLYCIIPAVYIIWAIAVCTTINLVRPTFCETSLYVLYMLSMCLLQKTASNASMIVHDDG